jgi:hypothetical protein
MSRLPSEDCCDTILPMIYADFLLLLLLQAANAAPAIPASPGVYFRSGDSQWVKIESASLADTRTKGLELFLETGGLYSPDMTIIYQGARAPMQLTVLRPTLYVRGIGSPSDAIMVQLTRRKDSRTLQTSASAVASDNKGGFRKKEIQSATVTVFADDAFSVTPDKDLKPGEYLLLLSLTHPGFDFGITPPKK